MRQRWITSAAAVLLSLGMPTLAWAQEEATEVSWAAMFLYSPGNVVGTAIIWLLLLMSMASMALIIMFLIQYRRSMVIPEDTRAELEDLLAAKKYRDAIEFAQSDPSYLGRLCGEALSAAGNGYVAMERAVEEAGDAETTRILRPVEYLNVLGNIAPMIGLFGTVYGMILAFQELVAGGGQADPGELASGISTALVTTFWGLVVAIPALAAYALIRNKIDALTSEGMLVAEDLISPFKPGGKKSRSGGSAPPPTPPASPAAEGGEAAPRPRATPKPEV